MISVIVSREVLHPPSNAHTQVHNCQLPIRVRVENRCRGGFLANGWIGDEHITTELRNRFPLLRQMYCELFGMNPHLEPSLRWLSSAPERKPGHLSGHPTRNFFFLFNATRAAAGFWWRQRERCEVSHPLILNVLFRDSGCSNYCGAGGSS